MRYPGTTAVCQVCGQVYEKAKGHNCPGPRTRATRLLGILSVITLLALFDAWYIAAASGLNVPPVRWAIQVCAVSLACSRPIRA